MKKVLENGMKEAYKKMDERSYTIGNVVVTLISQQGPKVKFPGR